jgi:hypothetical protein
MFFKLRYKGIPNGKNIKDSSDCLPKTQDYAKILQCI